MMNKIDYKDNPKIENGRLQCLAMDSTCANEPHLADHSSMRLLSDGSIDYAYYDQKARAIRSYATHGFVRNLLSVVVRVFQNK